MKNTLHRVALVYPYFRTRVRTEMLFPPLGIAALASQLHRLGIQTRIFDCTFQTFDEIQRLLIEYQPDIVGIHSMITLSRSTFRLAEMLRRVFPDCLLVVGGPLPTLYPEHFSAQFDVVFRGENDLSFPQFCCDFLEQGITRLQINKLPLERYAGLFSRQGDVSINNPTVHHGEKEIDTFPLPYRGDFDHQAYQKVWQALDGTKTASLITTFGCPFSCDFCSRPIFGNVFRRRSLDIVFQEVEEIIHLGYDNLRIADDNFTLDLAYLGEFCERIASKGLHWSCLSRVNGLDQNLVKLMKESGCRRVYLGLESGSQSTLQIMKKRATLEEGTRAVHLLHKAGIEVAAFFIVGYPGETVTSIEETFAFALALPFSSISFNVPFPLPGSKLFERISNLDETRDWNVENEVTFVYKSEFDQDWLRRRIDETMTAFAEKGA